MNISVSLCVCVFVGLVNGAAVSLNTKPLNNPTSDRSRDVETQTESRKDIRTVEFKKNTTISKKFDELDSQDDSIITDDEDMDDYRMHGENGLTNHGDADVAMDTAAAAGSEGLISRVRRGSGGRRGRDRKNRKGNKKNKKTKKEKKNRKMEKKMSTLHLVPTHTAGNPKGGACGLSWCNGNNCSNNVVNATAVRIISGKNFVATPFPFWGKEKSSREDKSSDLTAYSDRVIVEKDGVYIIFIQVLFYTDSPRQGLVLQSTHDTKPTNLTECMGVGHHSSTGSTAPPSDRTNEYQPCQTTTITRLRAGNTLQVLSLYPNTTIVTNPWVTRWELTRLGA